MATPPGLCPAWDLATLAERCGGRLLEWQRYDPACREWAKMASGGQATLGGLLGRWAAGDRQVAVFDQPLSSACPELLAELAWPPVVVEADLARSAPFRGQAGLDPFWDHPSLFLQPRGSQCGVHVDAGHSQFAQAIVLIAMNNIVANNSINSYCSY